MQSKFIDKIIKYDGSQLRSLYAYMEHGILGDSIISFIGPCDVSVEHMVDGEDLLAKAQIKGDYMLHFIIEEFGVDLALTVGRQRMLASIVYEFLSQSVGATDLYREGDDIYYRQGKLSISIATKSLVSGLIHFAVNITNEGTPVKTSSLNDLKIKHQVFSATIMERFVSEIQSMKHACCKVRSVP
ncbi:MAG: DUF366 family protein [Oligoflexia bacterium]|nr:DUF366 family protein [Oligoflexia bacterium]